MGMYLVTGAAGFIGSAVAKKLITDGHRVVTIDNLSTGYKSAIPEGCEIVIGDCQDPEVYNKIPQEKYDAILHIAGQSSAEISFDDPGYDLQTNAESTLHILKFCIQNGCSRVVYASTVSVYGVKPDFPVTELDEVKPESFYGVGKLASEHYLRIYQNHGINSTSLRLFNVYGPGQNLDNMRQGMVSIYLSQMLKNKNIHVKGAADRFRDFIYIDDVVYAFISAINCEKSFGGVINVATGVKTRVGDLIDSLILSYDKKVTVQYSGRTDGDVHGIYGCNQKMKDTLDFSEVTPLKTGLTKMISWAKNHLSD
jgi:UDP-glucose 4-epimerase